MAICDPRQLLTDYAQKWHGRPATERKRQQAATRLPARASQKIGCHRPTSALGVCVWAAVCEASDEHDDGRLLNPQQPRFDLPCVRLTTRLRWFTCRESDVIRPEQKEAVLEVYR